MSQFCITKFFISWDDQNEVYGELLYKKNIYMIIVNCDRKVD